MDSNKETMLRRLKFEMLARSIEANARILLDEDHSIQTKIQAMRSAGCAIRCASDDASDDASNDGVESVTYPNFNDYFKAVVTVAAEPMSEENVCKVLKHVQAAFSGEHVDEMEDSFGVKYFSSAGLVIPELCAVTIKIFIKFRNKSEIVRWCDNIFEEICFGMSSHDYRNQCWDIVVESGLIPTLTNAITTNTNYVVLADTTSSKVLCKYALNILSNLMSGPRELPHSVLLETAHPVLYCLLNSNNHGNLIRGCEIISQFLRKLGEETITLKFKDRKTGLEYILQVVEHCANFIDAKKVVGKDLKSCVLGIIGPLAKLDLDDLDPLLKVTLRILRAWECEVMARRILIIFSDLIRIQCDAVLHFLAKPAGLTGQNSLRFVIVNGLCEKYESIYYYDRPTVKLALVKIDEWCRNHPESQLHGEDLEAVRALLLSPDVSDVEGSDVDD